MILRKRFSDFSLTAVIPVVFAPIMFAVALTALPTPVGADALADFYKGKRMTLIVGSAPGGGYDAYALFSLAIWDGIFRGTPASWSRTCPAPAA